MQNKTIAIFDFDGTLTKGDTFLPFLIYSFGFWKTFCCLVYTFPCTLAYFLNLVSNHYAKEKMINYFFNDINVKHMNSISENFVEQDLNKYLRSNMIDRLKWHQKQNHITVLISASLNVYLKHWAKKFNFSIVEATLLEKRNSSYTGKIKGKNCYGIEKLNRLNRIFKNNFSEYETYGYGDSSGDKLYIDLCDFKYFKNDLKNL